MSQLEYLASKRVRPGKGGRTMIQYRCVCGKVAWMQQANWNRGQKSCGCLTKQILSKARTTHGHSNPNGSNGTPTYLTWLSMIDRCYYEKHKSYKDYGGRGITVCDLWRYSFEAFLSDMGCRPAGTTLGRIDNDGNYYSENCEWQTFKTQGRNRRSNTVLTHNGESKTLQEWAEITGIPRDAIGHRIRLGWSVADALTKPPRFQKNSRSSNVAPPSQSRSAKYMREVWRAHEKSAERKAA